jgi:hypothetical protein
MKINPEDYRNSLKNINASEEVKQKILEKNRDYDFGQWLVVRAKKEERREILIWSIPVIVMAIVFISLFWGTLTEYRLQYRLVKENHYIVAEYNKYGDDVYIYFPTSEVSRSHAVEWKKTFYFQNDGDTAKFYYIDRGQKYDFENAVPLLKTWVWIALFCAYGIPAMIFLILLFILVKKFIRTFKS